LSPNSSVAWLNVGDGYYRIFSSPDKNEATKQDAIKNAQSAYSEALRLYPTSAMYRAKLAEARQAANLRQ
jgi:hypothetical protein